MRIEDGWVKTLVSTVRKRERGRMKWSLNRVADLSRLRVICNDLKTIEAVFRKIIQLPYELVSLLNHYSKTHEKKYDTPYRGLWVIIAPNKIEKNKCINWIENMTTEIQIVTRRIRSIMDLNHPFEVSQELTYPSSEIREFVHCLFLKASILDLREYGSEKKCLANTIST